MAFKRSRTIPLLLSALVMLLAWSLTSTASADTGSNTVLAPTWPGTEEGRNLHEDGHSQTVQFDPSEPTALTVVTLSTRSDYSALMIFGSLLLVVGASLIIVVAWRSRKEAPIN